MEEEQPQHSAAAEPAARPATEVTGPAPTSTSDAEQAAPMLAFDEVDTFYGVVQVLYGVNYRIYTGEIVALLGSNGAGKTTTMKTIMGLVRPRRGQVIFQGRPIQGLSPSAVVKSGIAPVPEGRRIFGRLTVEDNLLMGAYTRSDSRGVAEDKERVYTLFPRLKERKTQVAGTMSGGEQQMLAMGRALMARPKLLIMDEPSMGLSPIFVERVFDTIQEINKLGTTIFMVEQNAFMALSIANRGYVLRSGHVVLEGPAAELLQSDQVRREYLGGA